MLQQKHCQSNSPLISHHHYNYHCLSTFPFSTFIRLSLHVTVQKQQAVHTNGGNFIFTNNNYMLFPFPLVARKLLPFPWDWIPMGMGIPIAMHTSTVYHHHLFIWAVLSSTSTLSTSLLYLSRFFGIYFLKRSSAIAERPSCSLFKLWRKYKREKRASGLFF